MIKSWLLLWKNTFNYKGETSIKTYWLSLIANVIAMYILVFPYALIFALIAKYFTVDFDGVLMSIPYLVVVHLPVLSIYFRRTNDVGWRISTTIYLAIVIPVFSGIIVGILPANTITNKFGSLILKTLALGFGWFLYGIFLGIILYDDPTALMYLSAPGLLLYLFVTELKFIVRYWSFTIGNKKMVKTPFKSKLNLKGVLLFIVI